MRFPWEKKEEPMAKKPSKKKHNPVSKEVPNKTGLTTSGITVNPHINMRRSELAKLVKSPGKMTKLQMIEELAT